MADPITKLLVSSANGIKTITINRPEKKNSLDDETVQLLAAAINTSSSDGTRVVVLTGSGDAFCSGAELALSNQKQMANFDIGKSLREQINPTIRAMRALPVPIIARVNGAAVGAGCNYALACDIIIASEHARFGQVFIRIALMPDAGGTHFLPRLVGYHKAFELMATGEIITAQQALELGMINRVVPVAYLDATVNELAERLTESPALPLAKMKAALNREDEPVLNAALEFEAENQQICFGSPDFLEGVTAFLEKRKAVFGRL